jgi:membrane protein required for colicin V production
MTPTTTSVLNSVDYFVLFTFGLSMLAGFMRGLLKEIISVITWIAAGIMATMFSGKLASTFSGVTSTAAESAQAAFTNATGIAAQPISMFAIAVSFIGIFIATMIAGYIISTIVTGVVQGTGAGLMNRLGGALFGGVRGFIIVIVLMFIGGLTPLSEQVAWQQSRFVNNFRPLVSWIDKMVQPGLESLRNKAESTMQNIGGQLDEMKGVFKNQNP